ncbi:uncharacterized protein LOC141659561 isoform X3 [Apium graveolens]|uniref:uncharacterized protein LOC141659561 isoform X3 n=1 Tax=Apium graveolens TaxID=4045 RepID=UPI003D7A24EE
MVSDNDLSVLGYVSDYICCLYGLRGAYGVVCVAQDSEVFARRGLQGIVGELLDRKDETGMKAEICSELGINQILKRNLVHLSSGEFQSFLPYLKNSGSQRSDAGKSTIGGQILFLIGQVDERTIQKNEREANDKSRKSWFLQGPETDPTTVRKIRDASITIRMLLSNLLTILKLYFIGVQLDGSKHVEPLQNSIPEATVKENSKLVKETAENIDEAVRELPDANSCLQKSSMLLSYHNFKWPGERVQCRFWYMLWKNCVFISLINPSLADR